MSQVTNLTNWPIGAINFLFALPAVRSVDTLGRRTWLLATLPFMAVFMFAAALSFGIESQNIKVGIAALFLFRTYKVRQSFTGIESNSQTVFAAVYSPGLGPIPFTLASESFPLSHREAVCHHY